MKLTARQQELADAALAILGREGMSAVTFRSVAAEAGWSLGAVQKAFPARTDLEAAMFQRLRETSVALPPGEPGTPTLHVWLVELMIAILPLDDARRTATLRASAFADKAGYDASLGTALRAGDDELRGLLTALVRRAQSQGEISADLDAATVAWAYLALIQGVAAQLLYGPEDEPVVRSRVEASVAMLLG